jgi:hypothetical protein
MNYDQNDVRSLTLTGEHLLVELAEAPVGHVYHAVVGCSILVVELTVLVLL